MRISLLLLLLSTPLFLHAKDDGGDCRAPKTKVKISYARNVFTKDGKPIEKGTYILIDKFIPAKMSQSFFKCNDLSFEKNGELKFRFESEKSFRSITYNDYISQPIQATIARGNANSRNVNINYCDFNSEKNKDAFMVSNPLQKKSFGKAQCFQSYFGSGQFWLMGADTFLVTNNAIDELILSSGKKNYRFKVNNGLMILQPKDLPEEGYFEIAYKSGKETSIIGKTYLLNLEKVNQNLTKDGFSKEDIRQVIEQNYLEVYFNKKTNYEAYQHILELLNL